MAIDFPSSPAEGQAHKGYVFRNSVWRKAPLATAMPRNLFVNPSAQISQERGITASPTANTGDWHPGDQWRATWVLGPSGTMFAQNTGNNMMMLKVGASQAVLSVAQYAQFFQFVEGIRCADLLWGTAAAQDALLRFSVFATQAGTYTANISNGPSMCFLAPFTVIANAWNDITIAIPGATTGTWPKTGSMGLTFNIGLAAGSTFIGVPGWQSGNFISLPGSTNFAATAGNELYFTNLGLYRDPYKTGVAPRFQMPDYAAELRRCQRYWYRQFALRGNIGTATVCGRMGSTHPAPMRAIPAASIVGTPRIYDGTVTAVMTSLASNTSNEFAGEFDVTCSAAAWPVSGRAGVQYYQGSDDHYVAVSARM